ncbi:MAG: exodeoxyribonuclease VII small subunit [Planctomycetota bacterium]
MRQKSATAPEATFDERLERLEAIVGELEKGGLSLELSIERYQEGVGLLSVCRTTLEQYKKRVEELTAGAEPSLVPYANDPDASASASR